LTCLDIQPNAIGLEKSAAFSRLNTISDPSFARIGCVHVTGHYIATIMETLDTLCTATYAPLIHAGPMWSLAA
jgi:hypothetical protein